LIGGMVLHSGKISEMKTGEREELARKFEEMARELRD
jgi:preprotein translocase subunit SecA